jgi:hypothetical protein
VKTGGVYDRSVKVFSVIAVILGMVLVILTVIRGGGIFSIGVLLGLAFVALGAARYRLQQRLGGER